MRSAGATLQKALFDALSADTVLQEHLGGARIYDHVPAKTAFPFVTLGSSRIYDWSTASERGEEHILSLHVWARGNGRKQALELMDLISICLDALEPVLDGHRLVSLMQRDMTLRNEDDANGYHGILHYRALTEPLAEPLTEPRG